MVNVIRFSNRQIAIFKNLKTLYICVNFIKHMGDFYHPSKSTSFNLSLLKIRVNSVISMKLGEYFCHFLFSVHHCAEFI